MRIVIVTSSLIYGGAETQIITLSRELMRRGNAVAIYTLNRHNPRATELDRSGVEIVADQKRRPFDPGVLWRLRRFLRKFRTDVVHGFLFDGDFYSRLAAVGTGIPALNSERSDNYKLNVNQRLGHVLTRHLASGVVANSHSGARFAQTLFGLPASRVHVAWNGIDLRAIDARVGCVRDDIKQTFFGRPDVRLACLVGSIKPAKDYSLALRTADMITRAHPQWRVLFVGEQLNGGEGYKAEIMREWDRLKLQGRGAFSGLRHDAIEIVSQCDVLFSTSVNEGFPNVVLEAMAAQTPVVSTEYSDIRRILPYSWQVIGNRQPESVTEAILRASAEAADVRFAQRQWVEQNATIEISARRMEAIYRDYSRNANGSSSIDSKAKQ